MATEGERHSPSEQLAAKIATALHRAGLIGGEQVARVEKQLAGGALGEAEWRELIEASLAQSTERRAQSEGSGPGSALCALRSVLRPEETHVAGD